MKFDCHFLGGDFLPIVPIKLKRYGGWIEFLAFIDTGASYSVFNHEVAELLDIKIENGIKTEIFLGDGDKMVLYLHKIPIQIAEKEMVATIAFSYDLKTSFNILGRKDIFEHFIVCFNEKEKWIGFKPLDQK